ncbi:Histidine-specific methyltransferase EgtD [Anaerohalosphaera lusitana]|uniref:Histidine-specific methyltransferase EgtD n=1 Tax=Anaerohalosphaera lusitana TaxID=1936003 RepID=A0A1U9NQE4_9BACT|nr:L-histidine N(alpha)-methyltransferase [Anaerohalosphaera lusitana]AQT70151.1 Histidine-specific methyltransferase EgtD [Anaerohalosphaera lusitana]
MATQTITKRTGTKVSITNYLTETDSNELIELILSDLNRTPRRISSRFFYDEYGSELFEKITTLPEYYLTRIEKRLLQNVAQSIAPTCKEIDIVELGSGDCSKISILLNAFNARHRKTIRYVPVDVSESAIKKSADILSHQFPDLQIEGIAADFLTQLHVIPQTKNHLFCFFGSTLGNLTPEHAFQFFTQLGNVMMPGDSLLLGLDRVKPQHILEKAYNDTQQVTSAFNKNILNVVNQIIGSDFNPQTFQHVAFYNEQHNRVEMHLKANEPMTINMPFAKRNLVLRSNEMLHTENSYKFDDQRIDELVSSSDLKITNFYSDRQDWFSVIWLTKP